MSGGFGGVDGGQVGDLVAADPRSTPRARAAARRGRSDKGLRRRHDTGREVAPQIWTCEV